MARQDEEDLNLPVPGQTSFWSVHDSFRAGLRDEPRNQRSTSKRGERQSASTPRRAQAAQEAVQLQVRQLELKQLELQVKLKRRLEEQAKEAKEAISAKQQQAERLKQHAFLEARERERDLSLRRTGGASRSGSASPRSRAGSPGSRSFEAFAAEELSVADSEEREARQADRARKVEKEREKIAWRAMQEEQAEKRKAIAREEAAKKEQAARKLQAFRSASGHQRNQARAFGEARKTELQKAEKGPSHAPQKVKPKVAVVEREPQRLPRAASAAERVETPRSQGRWAVRNDSPGATSRSRASSPEARQSRKRSGHQQATETSQARVVQKSFQRGQTKASSPPRSPSSRSQSPRLPSQVSRSFGTGSPAASPRTASRTPSPRKEGPDQRPLWLPVGRSRSQELAGGRQWWESNSPEPHGRDFSRENRQIRTPRQEQGIYTDSKEQKAQMEVTFGAPAARPAESYGSYGQGDRSGPSTPRSELRMQQIPRQQVDLSRQTSWKDVASSTSREMGPPRQQVDAPPTSPQDLSVGAVAGPWSPTEPGPQRCQNAWWVDLQGSSLPASPGTMSAPVPSISGASPSVTEPIERSLASLQLPHFPSQPLSGSYSWSASPASASADRSAAWQDGPRLGDHFAERLGLDVHGLPASGTPRAMATPAEVWQQRVRLADHQLLALADHRRSQSGLASGRGSPRSVSPRRSPAFGTSDPIIPALKIIQKYSDYFVASPSGSASPSPSRPSSRPRPPRPSSRPPSPPRSPPVPARAPAKVAPKAKASKASAVVYPRSKEVLNWQAAGFQASGSSYRGVKDAAGVRDGWGMLNQKDGTTYAGQWVSGKRHGAGTLMFDGGIFEGQWARGEASGSGIVRFHNGDKFEGQYISNRKHGFGVYSWADGATEEGQYFNGQKNDWHVWAKGASMWNLRYESGALVEALQVKGKKKEKPRSLPYPRAKESKEPSRQSSPRSLKTGAKMAARPKAKVTPAKAKVPVNEDQDPGIFTSDLMNQLQPAPHLEPPAEADLDHLEVALPSEAHQMF